MKFVDETTIAVHGGHGGDGFLSFRREKFLPKGGPDGGNGGKGGDVVLVVQPNLNTLADFRYTRTFRGKNGRPGSGKNCSGAMGVDCEVPVPNGTLVSDADSDEPIADMIDDDQRAIVAYGGKGGAGNAQFKSSTNRTPRKTTPGGRGEERRLRLELRILADVGFVGLPNAGKSTLLRSISGAKPRVGDYPFTTLHPELGIVERQFQRFTVADIPGLIEGAAGGAGLGIKFLRHLQRTRLLLHVLDVGGGESMNPIDGYKAVERELQLFDQALAAQPRWLVLNKADCLTKQQIKLISEKITQELPWTGPVYIVSGLTGEGCEHLINQVLFWMFGNKD